MSRNALDRMKAQGKAKSKENRVKRREEDMKRYGRNGHSASDKAYINGNYAKVASNKAYGYREGIKKGEIVRGTDTDWLLDGNIYRTTKVNENKSWKNYKSSTPKKSYKLFSSSDEDANTFKDHLNTLKLDGIKTAKENQRTGKHIGNAFEYIKGGAKDFILDPVVDAIKGTDYLGSTTVAGIAGLAEDSGNVFKAIADPERDLKYYSKGKSYIKENLKSNFDSLNKTGGGQSLSKYLHDARERGYEENYNLLKEQGRYEDAEQYKKNYESETPTATKALNVTGFVGDLLAPSTLENMAVGVGKGLVKNTAKSFKDMIKGTADISTAILPEETAKLMSKAKKYTGKGSGASDDVFYAGKKNATAIDNKLDNQYSKALGRVKDKVKKDPNTPNLGKFIDVLENSSYKGKQTSIDGRTLNKKYTQTKDGYVPQQIRSVADEINNVVNGRTGVKAKSQQFSMFGKDGTMNSYIDNIQNPNARYERVFNKYSNDIDALADKLDSMKPENADLMYDYLRKEQPQVYEQLVKGSDEIDEVIHGSARLKGYETEVKTKADKQYFGTKNVREFSNINKVDDVSKLNENYNKFNLERMFNQNNTSINPIKSRMSIEQGKNAYKQGVNNYLANISDLDYNGLKQSLNALEGISKMPKNTPVYKKVDILNDMLFDGQKVIRDNIPTKTLDGFVNYLEDNINFNMANKLGDKSFVKKDGSIFNLHDIDGKLRDISGESSKFAPALTDILFEDKMSDIASKLQVPNKKVLTDRRNELQTLKKQRVLTTDEFYELQDVKDKIDAWDKMYKEVANMGDEYIEYAQKTYGKANNTKGYNDMVDELAEKQGKLDGSKGKEREVIDSITNREVGSPRHQQASAGGVGEVSIPNRTTQETKALQKKVDTIRKALNLPSTKPVNVKLTKGQKLKDLPPVKENLAHLRKTIQKEVKYMFENPDKYEHFEEGFKQIKLGYVNTLRGLGVPDEKYFHKVTALQDELKSKMNKILEGGSENTPLLKMELQKLASRVDETFNNLDDVILDSINDVNVKTLGDINTTPNKLNNPFDEILNKVDEVDGFEKFNEDLNVEDSKNILKQIKNKSDKPRERATIDPRTEERLKYYENKLNLPKEQTLDELEFNIPGVDEDGVIKDLTNKIDNIENTPKNKSNNTVENPFYDSYKRWLNSYKKGLTVYNPGWHVQNYFQNKGQNYLALGLDAFKPQTDAKNVLKQINGEKFKDKLIWDNKSNKAYTIDEIAKLAQDFNVVDGLGEDVKNARGIFSNVENYIDNTPLMKRLEKNEQTARLHHFIKQIEKGMSPEDASKSVNKYLFDYSKKNNVDKVIGDYIDPFWTFHKNNARLMYTSGLEHGDKIAKINRATSGLEEGIPKEQVQNEEYKYGKTQLPYANLKDDVNKDDYNYLYKQNVMPDFEGAFALNQDDLENKLNPIVRLLLQQSRGEGNFGNKIVEDEAGFDEITKDERVKEVISELNPFMPNLVKTINSQINRKEREKNEKQGEEITDKQILHDWINYITGNKGNWYRNLDM